jgi:hypothetical protein
MKKIFFSIALLLVSIATMGQFSHIINANTTWSSDPALTGNIWIRTGVTLTIQSGVTVNMPQGSFIYVDVDATLFANGVNFRAADVFWQGITCRGTNSIFTTASIQEQALAQPLVQISNSQISGMSVGIWSSSMIYNFNGETVNSTGGGILRIHNTVFSNNPATSGAIIGFNHNMRVVNQNYINDAGFVSKCTFNDIYDNAIYVHSSRNVRITGSEFNGSSGQYGTKRGVYCNSASVSIDGYSTFNSTTPCSFNNLNWGVFVNDPGLVQQSSFIRGAEFVNCKTGIVGLSSNNIRILSNTMSVPSLASETHGIHLTGCTGFTIQENTIMGTATSGDPINTWGILIDGSGSNANVVYNNTLIDCEYGLSAQNCNRDPIDLELGGLKFQCNDFNSFNSARYMAALTSDPTNPSHGVSALQAGAIVDEPTSPAYNSMYDRNIPGTDNDFYNEHTSGIMDILYIVPYNSGVYDLKYHSPSVYKSISTLSTDSTPHCESRLPCYGPQCPISAPEEITSIYANYSSLRQSLANAFNGGEHAYMLDLVNNVNSSNRLFVYYELLTKTPSYEVLAIACAKDVFYNFMIRDVLVANSYGIKSQAVRDALDQRLNPLTTQQMDDVLTYAENISSVEELMFQISYMEQEYYNIMNTALCNYLDLEDSENIQIIQYFDAMGDFYSQIRAIMMDLENRDIASADTRKDALMGYSVLEDEKSDFEHYYEIVRNVYEGYSGDFHSMDILDEEILLQIDDHNTYAGHLAKSLLQAYFNYDFEPVSLRIPESSRKGKVTAEIKASFTPTFYPNPTNSSIQLLSNGNTIAKIVITDIQGKIILSKNLESIDAIIDIKDLSNGMYLVHFYTTNERIATQKLIKY